ncbi:unnamed protein product [Ixodes pacificus]
MGKIVVPRLLDERSEDGRHVVVIDDSMTLRLQKSSVLAERIVVSGFDDVPTTPEMIESRELEKNLYEDPDHMASLMMRVGHQGLQLDGMLNPTLKISPLAVTARRRVASGLLHKVELIEHSRILRGIRYTLKRFVQLLCRKVLRHFSKRQTAIIITSVYPEVSVVCDVSHNTVFTWSELIGYLIIFWNAVNLRYRSFTAPAVRFKVVGIHQMTQEEDVFYIGPASPNVEGVATTRQFARRAPVTKYGNPDMFMILTGCLQWFVKMTLNILLSCCHKGYGYTGEICGPLKVAIAEDKAGTYKGVHTAAHEAAHLLGVVHDGDGPAANIPGHPGAQRLGCAWADGYMMSYVDNGPRFSRFSPCAQEQIRVTLK